MRTTFTILTVLLFNCATATAQRTVDMTAPAAAAPSRLFITSDEDASEEVTIEAGGRTAACRTPCDVRVPNGTAVVRAGRARRTLTLAAGEAYDVDIDSGWNEDAHNTYIAGHVGLIAGARVGTGFYIAGELTRPCRDTSLGRLCDLMDIGLLAGALGGWGVAVVGAIIVFIGQADHAGGGVLVRDHGHRRWSQLQLIPSVRIGGAEGDLVHLAASVRF